jgi:uncharacterized protein
MEMPFELTFAGGVLLGFASTLHCVGMCGPIASGLIFSIAPELGFWGRLKAVLVAQLGKSTSYLGAGMLLGLLGSGAYTAFDQSVGFHIAQWAGAASLGWVGLSVAGLVPSVAGLDGLWRPVGALMTRVRRAQSSLIYESAFAGGVIWGIVPCGMVYAALMTALLTGSPTNGGLLMLGFSIGTVPAVTGATLGITSLVALRQKPRIRIGVGVAIATVGFAGLALSAPGGPLCISPP